MSECSRFEVTQPLPTCGTSSRIHTRIITTHHTTMSVTTTANPLTYNVSSVLADYEIAHSDSDASLDTTLNPHPTSTSLPHPEPPRDWPVDHRRIPTYRPINTELDQSQRRVYQNPIERAFIIVMFSGVFLESVSAQHT